MKQIPLSHGKVALVDDADFESLSAFRWRALYHRHADKWYAMRSLHRDGKLTSVMMHRQIMGAPAGIEVDHIDGDGLNNQRSTNLRLATSQQNKFNTGRHKNNTSGYKGVSLDKRTGLWEARTMLNRRNIIIGRFPTPLEASRAYTARIAELHGEFARA